MNRLMARFRPGFSYVRDRESARKWAERTRQHEIVHIVYFGLSLPMIFFFHIRGKHGLALFLWALTIPFTVYPIMLQRYNRARIHRIFIRHGKQVSSI